MNLLRPPVRFSGPQLFTQLSPSCWCTITHQVIQTILKRIYSSPSASRQLRRFFKSISLIMRSWDRRLLADWDTSAFRKQDFCNKRVSAHVSARVPRGDTIDSGSVRSNTIGSNRSVPPLTPNSNGAIRNLRHGHLLDDCRIIAIGLQKVADSDSRK